MKLTFLLELDGKIIYKTEDGISMPSTWTNKQMEAAFQYLIKEGFADTWEREGNVYTYEDNK